MTDKKLNFYGMEKSDEALAAFLRLKQMGYEVPDNDKFISDVINTNINFNMTMAAANKAYSVYKIGDFVFGAKMIKYMDLFLKTQKNVVVKMYKEDIAGGDYRKPKNERAVVLEGDSAKMVVMPLCASRFNENNIIYIGEAAA